ncbi:hypothetical protein HX004_02515 [Myroides sp. 1354]|uniref:hypothetical protein n=1 Tax=unclassified Myroides TaxID=2642485 RepID=UPI002577CE57|nr:MULTISPECIES: hypothetical protein [unclassified Myroides]MDM1043288.1 hypothetical protein [Myroides sp. R163-1]MDM1054659.1 hypothetical protein [Myroides sp. 1354]MDM1067956.1 hypothetical protein [Myroides sp. 1372]
MVKLHLTTTARNKLRENQSVFIYSETKFIKEITGTTSSNLVLDDETTDLIFTDGQTQQYLSLEQIKTDKQSTVQLTEDLIIQLRINNSITLLDCTNSILALLSGTLAIGYSIFTNSNWREFLFILGSTIIVLFVFMWLYKQTINARNYNIRMYAAISALILIFILIPFENWTLKTLIGLSTLTVITRFIKDYQRSLRAIYHPLTKG